MPDKGPKSHMTRNSTKIAAALLLALSIALGSASAEGVTRPTSIVFGLGPTTRCLETPYENTVEPTSNNPDTSACGAADDSVQVDPSCYRTFPYTSSFSYSYPSSSLRRKPARLDAIQNWRWRNRLLLRCLGAAVGVILLEGEKSHFDDECHLHGERAAVSHFGRPRWL